MKLTDAEATEVAAECVAALEWQVTEVIANPNSGDIEMADLIAALTPRGAATRRVIEAMKQGDGYQAMKEAVTPDGAKIVLTSTTCMSIAGSLAMWGFPRQADEITAAIERADVAASGH
jgi:hypothetical protein